MSDHPPLRFIYRNYRGEETWRTVIPMSVSYGQSVYHPKPQWILNAFCLDRKENRGFAFSGIIKVLGDTQEERQNGSSD